MFIDLDKVDAIFFDLDDTLLDTAGQIVPRALEVAARRMIKLGLLTTVDNLTDYLRAQAAQRCGLDYFSNAVSNFGCPSSSATEITAGGRRAFLDADFEELEPFPESVPLLRALRQRCLLLLVTAGSPRNQRAKLSRLGLQEEFDEIRCVSSVDGQDKLKTFKDTLDERSLIPERCVSVGDRAVSDIRYGNRLGMITVRIRQGEFGLMAPRSQCDVADYEVPDLKQLSTLFGVEP